MSLKDSAKRSRRRKIAWAAVALLLVFGAGRFLFMRVADRRAWPAIVAALQCHRRSAGAFPETLDELLASGLLEEADVRDPFSQDDAARLGYQRDGDGWRLHSAGLDQVDGGGLVDAYRATDAKTQRTSDFVFISREREARLASYRPPPPAASAPSAEGN